MRLLAIAAAGLLLCGSARAESVLTVAMTAGDIPVTTGTPDQGFEGYRFVANSLYDELVEWDLSHSDRASTVTPGLASEWHIDPANNKRWIFALRQGVKWHDGCDFSADDVVWNFGRLLDDKSPQFNTQQFAFTRGYLTSFAGIEKLDDHTIAIDTKTPDSLFPFYLTLVPMISRCRAEAVKYDWNAFANNPSGTGPYRFARMVPHERLELLPNKDYWNKARVPKQHRLVLIPMPEASTRVAALLSGQVNFAEAPPPDTIARLKSAGMQVLTNSYPHNWAYQLNFVKGPFTDIRVRRAANYAINRNDVVDLLDGTALASYSTITPSTPYYGHPMRYEYDPAKATALLKEAGCYPCAIKLAISPSGSGQMQPLSMNELVKSQLEAVGFKVDFDVMDWNALSTVGREGVDKHMDISGVNISRAAQDPFYALIRHVWTVQWAPAGANWGHYSNPDVDALVKQILATFDPEKQTGLLAELNEKMNEQAVMIWVVHDLNPRALSPKLHGFVQAQNWFQDLTPITVSP
jgi:ABC-type transport system substrate-binding protein